VRLGDILKEITFKELHFDEERIKAQLGRFMMHLKALIPEL
jgi:hypothetical protein